MASFDRTEIATVKPDIIRASRSEAATMTLKFFLSLLFVFMLAGCGQSGPLYIPGDPSSVEMPQQADEDDEENREDDRP